MKKNKIEQNRIHIHQIQDEVVEYQKKEKKHDKKISTLVILFCIWIAVFFFSLFFTLNYNQWDFSIAWIIKYASLNIENFYYFVTGSAFANGMDGRFFMYINIALAGAALASCGAIFQGSMKNILVGPSTMGVMAGGSLGNLVYVLVFTTTTYYYTQQFCVLAGCFFSVFFVLSVAMIAGKGKVSATTMVICGMVFSSVISNLTMIVQYYMIVKDPNDSRIEVMKNMMMGNFNNLNHLAIVFMMGIPCLISFAFLIGVSGKLNLLSMGDDEATVAGLNVGFYRNLMIVLGTVLTAIVIAFCGRVGFVGFMVPMITRKMVGPDMRILLPTSMIVGAILLTVIFDVAYFFGITDSMNVITSAIGCIVMAITLVRKKKGGPNYATYKATNL